MILTPLENSCYDEETQKNINENAEKIKEVSALHVLNLNEHKIKVSEKVKDEMRRLRTHIYDEGSGAGFLGLCSLAGNQQLCTQNPHHIRVCNVTGLFFALE